MLGAPSAVEGYSTSPFPNPHGLQLKLALAYLGRATTHPWCEKTFNAEGVNSDIKKRGLYRVFFINRQAIRSFGHPVIRSFGHSDAREMPERAAPDWASNTLENPLKRGPSAEPRRYLNPDPQ